MRIFLEIMRSSYLIWKNETLPNNLAEYKRSLEERFLYKWKDQVDKNIKTVR